MVDDVLALAPRAASAARSCRSPATTRTPSGVRAAALLARAGQRGDLGSPAAQGLGQVAADEARRAGDQRLHIGRS